MLGIPEFEPSARRREICAQLPFEALYLVTELEQLVVEPALMIAAMNAALSLIERRAAIRTGHEAGEKHKTFLKEPLLRSRSQRSQLHTSTLRVRPERRTLLA